MDLDCDPDAAAHCAAAIIRKTAITTVSVPRCAATTLAAVSLIRGYNFVMMKIGLAYAGPLAFATLRLRLGALCLIPVVIKVGDAIPGAPSVVSGVVAGSHARHQFRLHAESVATSLCELLILIQRWNLCGGLAASLLATCAGMFWGVSVVYVTNLQKRTNISMLMIAPWQMIFGAPIRAIGWFCLDATPIRWAPPLMVSMLYNGVLGTGVA
jgi:hypothetical protein